MASVTISPTLPRRADRSTFLGRFTDWLDTPRRASIIRLRRVEIVAARKQRTDELGDAAEALYDHILYGRVKAVRAALEFGVDPNKPLHPLGELPLIEAIRYAAQDPEERACSVNSDVPRKKYKAIVQLLIDHDARGDLYDRDGRSAITEVMQEDFSARKLGKFWQDVFARLLEQVEDVNAQSADYPSLLHQAVEAGNTSAAAMLLARGADINLFDKSKYRKGTPLMASSKMWGTTEMTEFLLEEGATVFDTMAAWTMNPRQAALLLNYTNDVNARDPESGGTMLHKAVLGNTEVLCLLINRGVDPMLRDKEGRTALDVVSEFTEGSGTGLSESWHAYSLRHNEGLELGILRANRLIIGRAMMTREAGYDYRDLHFHPDGTCTLLGQLHLKRLALPSPASLLTNGDGSAREERA